MRQIVERGDDRPAVHLRLVDLLGAVIEAGGVAEADGVGGREQAEGGMRADHLRLVEQRQLARAFEDALDDEHDVGAAGVIFVEHQRHIVLIGPGQDAFAEFGDLLAVLQHDRVLADQVDAADVAVEIDADAGPVEAGGDLLDMGRFAGAVIARHHDAAVVGEAREDGERGLAVEQIVLVDFRHMLGGLGISGDVEIRIKAEQLLAPTLSCPACRSASPLAFAIMGEIFSVNERRAAF